MVPLIVGAIVLIIVVLLVVGVMRRRQDPVDSFRRQIDALSPEARRPTVDQVRDAADESASEPVEGEPQDPRDDRRADP